MHNNLWLDIIFQETNIKVAVWHQSNYQNSANATLRLSREEQQSHTVGAKGENWKRELAHIFSFSAFGVLALRLILPRRSSEGSSKMSQGLIIFRIALRPFLAPFYRQNSANTTLRLSRGEQQSHTAGAKGENWKRELAHRFSISTFEVLALRLILPRRSSEKPPKEA